MTRMADRGTLAFLLPDFRGGGAERVALTLIEEYVRRGYSVETNLISALPMVAFDPDAVAEVVVNLLDNAAKYSGDSKFVGVRMLAEDSAVIFEVADRGIGISAEEHEKIFQQFYRSGTRSGKGGYGLGLVLVKHIMDAHGGRVEVQSEIGLGSRFRLVFPARPPGADEPSGEAS